LNSGWFNESFTNPIFPREMAGERRIAAWRMDKGGGPLF